MQDQGQGLGQATETRRAAAYVYAFLLSSSDRELDATVRQDGCVCVVASCNERAGRALAGDAGLAPSVQLSAQLSRQTTQTPAR